MSDPTVRLLADERLQALWGQSLLVGGHTVHLPEEPAPIEVPAWVGAKLVAQDGWRYAPAPVPTPAATAPPAQVRPPVAMLSSKQRKKARATAWGLEVAHAKRKD